MSEYHPVIQRRRERELNKRFIRMLAVSALAHFILLASTAALSRHKPESSLRMKAISVNLHAAPARAAKDSKPEGPVKKAKQKSIPKPAETASRNSKAEKESKPKTISVSPEKDSSAQEDKSQILVTDTDRQLMDSALADISSSLRSDSEAEEDAEWGRAFQEITSNLQVMTYYEQARAIYLEAWTYPPSVLDEERSGCRMIIYVLQDGTVKGYKMVRSSGNPVLDQSVVRAVKKVRSLPPLPWLVADPPFALRFEFKPEKESRD